jgi:hypothetical protein
LWLGIQPQPVLNMLGPSVQNIVDRYEVAREQGRINSHDQAAEQRQ